MSALPARKLFSLSARPTLTIVDRPATDLRSSLVDRIPALSAYAQRLCGDPAVVEELVQETLLTAIRKADDFELDRPLGPWLCGILRRHFLHERRRNARRSPAIAVHVEPARSAADATIAAELACEVRRRITDLPTQYREVVELFYLDGLGQAEIAIRLRRCRSTISTQLNRGIERLRAACRHLFDSDRCAERPEPPSSSAARSRVHDARAPRLSFSVSSTSQQS